jgi:cytoskeletal protein RodZ
MRAILIAAAVVLVLAGGGVAAFTATDDDSGPAGEQLLGQEPSSTDDSPAPTDTAPTETSRTEQTQTTTSTSSSATSPTDTTATPAQPQAETDSGTPTKATPPPHDFSVPPGRKFSGTGNASLGTVNVSATSILRWRAKGHFEVRFGRQDFSVIAPTKTGQIVIPPFNFNRVRVIARGAWTIWVSPQK